MISKPTDKPTATALRALVSLGLLGALALWLEPTEVIDRIQGVDPFWVAAALAIGTLQFVLSAERWRRTAARLEVPLGRREALASYYVAGFANQVLPGGVAGDAGRAWRHSRTSGRSGPAVHAVVLERASGQFVVFIAVIVVLLATPTGNCLLTSIDISGTVAPGLATLSLAALTAGFFIRRAGFMPGWLRALGHDTCRAVLARRAWPIQLALSLAVLATCCAMFVCAARMIGSEAPAGVLAALAPVVLLAMLLPISVGGWGVRETAAAGVWVALGWPAAEGVAISMAYGVLSLLASSPGALLALSLPAGRRR